MTQTIAPTTSIGEVDLSVSNLERSLIYYQNGLGFALLSREDNRAVLGAGGNPLLVLVEKPGARPSKGVTGLYHFAVLLPNRRSLARLIYHLAEDEIELGGAADHGVSEALYLSDPDGNGIELYRDRKRGEWPRDDIQRLQMVTEELDLDDLLLELKGGIEPWQGLPAGTRIGHVHLHVSNLPAAEQFYTKVLGFDLMQRIPGSLFVSAGGYHHHIGLNTWAGEGIPAPAPDMVGLRWFDVVLPDEDGYQAVLERLKTAGIPFEDQDGGILVRDASNNGIFIKKADELPLRTSP